MKRYEDYKKDKKNRELTREELDSIVWPKYKIVVPAKEDREELMEAFKHIHYSDIDTDIIAVNQLAHEYLDNNNIVVDEKLFDVLDKKNDE